MQESSVDFQALKRQGLSPQESALHGVSAGLSRLEVIKAVHLAWGDEFFDLGSVELLGSPRYPGTSARAAATVGLAAIVLSYPDATYDEVKRFEATTGISRKVEALAQANRVEDALRFYERLIPGELSLRPITRDAAEKAAGKQTLLSEHPWGWVFGEQSADRQERLCLTFIDRFVGAAIVVDGDEDKCVTRYERTGWPASVRASTWES